MIKNRKIFSAGMVSLLVGLSVGGVAIGAVMDRQADGSATQNSEETGIETAVDELDFSSGPVQCEIVADAKNGSLSLQSVVHTLEPVEGSYRLKVASVGGPNRSSIQQGGYFSADEHKETVLGKLMLGARGAVYDVSLSVVVNGKTIGCEERIGTT